MDVPWFCPRTYVGLEEPKGDDALPRYSIRSFPLVQGRSDGNRFPPARLRTARATARLHVTRIIDLTGHANSPNQRPNVSYVCLFLGDKWHRVTLGDAHESDGIGDDFIQALRRARATPAFPERSGDSLDHRRLWQSGFLGLKNIHVTRRWPWCSDKDALSFSSVALRAVAHALGSSDREVEDATSLTMGYHQSSDRPGRLSLLGRNGAGK